MGLATHLPDRPLRLAETMRPLGLDGLELVAPLYGVQRSLTENDEELVVAVILGIGDSGELAGFDPTAMSWASVVSFPDIGDVLGVPAALDVLETWLSEQYSRNDLVHIAVDVGQLRGHQPS